MLSAVILLAQQSQLVIDPMLIVQAEEVWSIIGSAKNPVWPGWNAKKTPLLFYFPGKQDVLINHPKPPEGFELYTGPVKSKIGPIYIRNGKTTTDRDGQNTSMDVNGVRTLVVADTQSSHRQWIQNLPPSILGQPTKADLQQLESGLFKNPLDSMLIVAHEAFHVFQDLNSKKAPISELSLTRYPTLSPENNTGFALEAELLANAVQAKTKEEAKQAATEWLALRLQRRKALNPEAIGYEDGVEFIEGLAKYVEYASLQAFKTRKPAAAMWLMQGFEGYANPVAQENRMIRSMKGFMNGTNVVNNDPYGTAPVRFRMYFSGMGIGAMLDKIGANWKPTALDKDVTLTGLVKDALNPSQTDLDTAWAKLSSTPAYAKALGEKRELEAKGLLHIQEVLASFDAAPCRLIIDYSGLDKPKVGLSFTPFGLLRIDENRTVYRTIPLQGICNDLKFSEDSARPMMMDNQAKQLHIQLTAMPTVADLKLNQITQIAKLSLPGLSLENVNGTFSLEGKTLMLKLR